MTQEVGAITGPVESWFRDQVVPAYDRLAADPSTSMSPDQVRART